MDLDEKFKQWQRGELSNSELLMWATVTMRRLVEIQGDLLELMRKIEDAELPKLD